MTRRASTEAPPRSRYRLCRAISETAPACVAGATLAALVAIWSPVPVAQAGAWVDPTTEIAPPKGQEGALRQRLIRAILGEAGVRSDEPDAVEDHVLLAFVGDILLHLPLQKQSADNPDGFASLWAEIAPFIRAADVAYANLEGVIAPGIDLTGAKISDPGRYSDMVYTGYPRFNYPATLGPALKAAGIDVVSTANNHSLDRFAIGVDLTLDELRLAGLVPFGTTHRNRPIPGHYAVTEVGSIRIAWIACTYGTNGIPDHFGQVLMCYEQRSRLLDLTRELADREDIDTVIVAPHWGREYRSDVSEDQRSLASDLTEAGADLVIGSHPHVLQTWEQILQSNTLEPSIVFYSLGNFVSNQQSLPRRTSVILFVVLETKGRRRFRATPADGTGTDGTVQIRGAGYVPIAMTWNDGDGDAEFSQFGLQVPATDDESSESRALVERLLGESRSLERLVPTLIAEGTSLGLQSPLSKGAPLGSNPTNPSSSASKSLPPRDSPEAMPPVAESGADHNVRPKTEASEVVVAQVDQINGRTESAQNAGATLDTAASINLAADASEFLQVAPAVGDDRFRPTPVEPVPGDATEQATRTSGTASAVLEDALTFVLDRRVHATLSPVRQPINDGLAKLERENAALRQIVVDQMLENEALKRIIVVLSGQTPEGD